MTQDFVILPPCAGSGERVIYIPGRLKVYCPVCGLELAPRLVGCHDYVLGKLETLVETHEERKP